MAKSHRKKGFIYDGIEDELGERWDTMSYNDLDSNIEIINDIVKVEEESFVELTIDEKVISPTFHTETIFIGESGHIVQEYVEKQDDITENVIQETADDASQEHSSTSDEIQRYIMDVVMPKPKLKPWVEKKFLMKAKNIRTCKVTSIKEGAQFKCFICKFSTATKVLFQEHMIKHPEAKFFYCLFCPFVAPLRKDCNAHMAEQHPEERVHCQQCSYSTMDKVYMNRHMQTHLAETLYCRKCSYTTTKKQSLKLHKRLHTGRGIIFCKYCNYYSTTKANVKKHEGVHTGVGQRQCPFCPFATVHRHSFQRHCRKHTGEGLLQCPHCPHRSASSDSHKVHVSTHHRKPHYKHKCDYEECPFTTVNVTYYKQHMKQKHGVVIAVKKHYNKDGDWTEPLQ